MAPTLAPPAGGWKWRDDEYWNKHEGLMTQTWPALMEKRELVKNKPMTINARTLSSGNLPGMTIRPRDRPKTVPADMGGGGGRRFLDNIDLYMGKPGAAPGGADGSAPSTPGGGGRPRGTSEMRSSSEAQLGGGTRVDPRSPFKDNMYFFGAGMGSAEPLAVGSNDKARATFGLRPMGSPQNIYGAPAQGQMIRKMGPPITAFNGTSSPMGMGGVNGLKMTNAAEGRKNNNSNANIMMGM